MDPAFALISIVTLGSAIAAMSLRNLVHCALSLTITFAGLAALYLNLHAQFIGFAQVLVYVGAVAILIVFAILLTRSGETSQSEPSRKTSWWSGLIIAVLLFGCLAGAILRSSVMQHAAKPAPQAPVAQIGDKLMKEYVLPLEVMGLLLTAAMLGAVVIALRDKPPSSPP